MRYLMATLGFVVACAAAACDSPPPSGDGTPSATTAAGTTAPAAASTSATAASSSATSSATTTAAASGSASAEPKSFAGTNVEFPSKGAGGKGMGYLSLPSGGPAKHPAVIVIQEWWGMNDWIKANTDMFAQKGDVALAVDLYRGKSTKDPGEAHELMRGLPEDRALADLQGAVDWLAARTDVDPKKIGAIGWCMGGGHSLALAVAEPRLKAAVINYGRLVTDPASIAKVQADVLGNFAADDRGIPKADVLAFEKAMKGAKKNVDIKIFDGVGHAFMNPNNTQGYDRKAADDAWARIHTFFAKELPP